MGYNTAAYYEPAQNDAARYEASGNGGYSSMPTGGYGATSFGTYQPPPVQPLTAGPSMPPAPAIDDSARENAVTAAASASPPPVPPTTGATPDLAPGDRATTQIRRRTTSGAASGKPTGVSTGGAGDRDSTGNNGNGGLLTDQRPDPDDDRTALPDTSTGTRAGQPRQAATEADRGEPYSDDTGPVHRPIGHLPALDGLRALAVCAVIFYHAGLTWMPGGLLGVDTFFVLSGFLITGLLIVEYRTTRRIDLKSFWTRRMRRLMPALLLLLLGIAAYAQWIADPTDVASIRLDSIATLFYVANWRFALSEQSYFDHFAAPSPLLHTWSLAVEEQFYVLWPLVVYLFMRHSAQTAQRWSRQRHKAQSAALTVAVLGAEASALVGLFMLLTGFDPSRIYYGTDTRIQALLVGAALAVWRAQRPGPLSRQLRMLLGVGGVVALVATIGIWATVDGESEGLYAGGFLAVAITVALLVAAIVEVPNGVASRILTLPPLPYIGKISYGLYLWHWPVFLTLTAGRTGVSGTGLLLLRLAVTFAVTMASFHLVENPVRRGTFRIPRPRLAVPATVAGVLVVVVVATSGSGNVTTPADFEAMAEEAVAEAAPQGAAEPGANAPGATRPLRLMLVGDSVSFSLGWKIGPAARENNVTVYPESIIGCGVARLPQRIIAGTAGPPTDGCSTWPDHYRDALSKYQALGTPPDVVVVLIGRWEVTDQLLDGQWTHVGEPAFDAYLGQELDLAVATMSAGGAKVVLLTSPVFEPLEDAAGNPVPETQAVRVVQFNKVLRAAAARHPGVAEVIEFGEMMTPGNAFTDYFDGTRVRDDGVHFNDEGARLLGDRLLTELISVVGASRPGTDTDGRSAPPG